MSTQFLKKEFVSKYLADGERKFIRMILLCAMNKITMIESGNYKGPPPDIELLELSSQFLTLYRREGDEIYFTISKIFKRVAHKIYRKMLHKKITPTNAKFLNLV